MKPMARALMAAVVLVAVPRSASGQGAVLHFWSGALSSRSIRVNAQVDTLCEQIRLVVDDDPLWGSPVYSIMLHPDTSTDRVAHLVIDGLQPATAYNYRFEVDGAIDTSAASTGRFRTPGEGPFSFSFVTGSCNGDGLHPVWQSMGWLHPLFFLEMGDLHYGDVTDTLVQPHRDAYVDLVYNRPPMMDLFHRTPLAYVWDDHDFCGNGSMGNAPGKVAAARAYRDHVPHYPLPDDTAVYQAFTIGRVRFIVTDLHSQKKDSTMMDSAQYVWLLNEVQLARDNGQVACWVNTLTWNSIDWPENWGSQPGERQALSDIFRASHIKDLFMLSGDAHMLAIDDGANCDFSTGQDSPYRYPVFQAAALNRGGSYKGGVFDQGGWFPNPTQYHGQFGQVIVDDDGIDVCITFNGWRTDSMSANISSINTYTFCRTPSGAATPPAASDRLRAWIDADGDLEVSGVMADGVAEVNVSDPTGRLLRRGRAAVSGSSTRMGIGPLAGGLYVVTIEVRGARWGVRFIVP